MTTYVVKLTRLVLAALLSSISTSKLSQSRSQALPSLQRCFVRNWCIGRVAQVYPGKDGHVRNVKVKTATGEYRRPITKIVVIYPAEGYED